MGSIRLLTNVSTPKRAVPTIRKYDSIGIRMVFGSQQHQFSGGNMGRKVFPNLCCRSHPTNMRGAEFLCTLSVFAGEAQGQGAADVQGPTMFSEMP
jgi:hypothetical protein